MRIEDVIKRRAEERAAVIEGLRAYSERLRARLGEISIVLFGSYARGDFNLWSDVDIIVVSSRFKGVEFVKRCLELMDAPPKVEPICWTPEEALKMLEKPSWREALKHCVAIADDHRIFGMCEKVRS